MNHHSNISKVDVLKSLKESAPFSPQLPLLAEHNHWRRYSSVGGGGTYDVITWEKCGSLL